MSELPDFIEPGQSKDLCIPRFYQRPVQNNFRSQKEGRPIFDEVDYVEILVPGNRGSVVDERVNDSHKARWPKFYDAFKQGQTLAETGTPLEEWAAISRAQVEELKHFNIRTVETLAALGDDALSRAIPMGGHSLRAKAQRTLEMAKGAAPTDALAAEAQQLRDTIAVMQTTIDELNAECERLKAAKGVQA